MVDRWTADRDRVSYKRNDANLKIKEGNQTYEDHIIRQRSKRVKGGDWSQRFRSSCWVVGYPSLGRWSPDQMFRTTRVSKWTDRDVPSPKREVKSDREGKIPGSPHPTRVAVSRYDRRGTPGRKGTVVRRRGWTGRYTVGSRDWDKVRSRQERLGAGRT